MFRPEPDESEPTVTENAIAVSWNGGRSVAAWDSSASIDQSMRATLPINVARLDLIPVTAELVPLYLPEARV
jgi:hypothetical protein